MTTRTDAAAESISAERAGAEERAVGGAPREADRRDRAAPPDRPPDGGGKRNGTGEGAPGNGPRDRHLRVGVSHPSGDPARHRTFEVRAALREDSGWVAHLTEDDPNDQPLADAVSLHGADRPEAFPTAAACLGDAVAMLVRMVDGDAAEEA
jgi:hypothetical protein